MADFMMFDGAAHVLAAAPPGPSRSTGSVLEVIENSPSK